MKKHPADVLAATVETAWLWHATPTFCAHVAAMLRAIPALEKERDARRAELAALKAQAAQPAPVVPVARVLQVGDDTTPANRLATVLTEALGADHPALADLAALVLAAAPAAPQAAQPAPADPVATLHDDGYFTWKRDEFRLKFHQPLAGWRMDVYAAPQAAQPNWDALRHAANEWADMATNGLQWVRNINDGISTPAAALENLEACLKHCQEVNDAAQHAASSAPQAAQPERSMAIEYLHQQVAKKLRNLPAAPQAAQPSMVAGYVQQQVGEGMADFYKAYPLKAHAVQPKCDPTLTECPRCHNDIKRCDGVYAAPQAAQPLTFAEVMGEMGIGKEGGAA